MNFAELKSLPAYKKFSRLALLTVLIWLLGFVLLSNALLMIDSARSNLSDAERIASAASEVRAVSGGAATPGKEPLSEVSEIIDELNIRDRIGQMSSGPSGLVLRINNMTMAELTGLSESLAAKGLNVKSAELRAMNAGGGRRIQASMTLEAAGQ
jgi:hypothetical protein